MPDMTMTPTRPYLLRAVYEWIVDNDCTPYIAVNAQMPSVQVPTEHIVDGRIILNLAPAAIVGLNISNEFIEFSARFSGVARNIYIPIRAVLGIYAKENGQGMAFPEEEYVDEAVDLEPDPEPPRPAGRPTLKVVK